MKRISKIVFLMVLLLPISVFAKEYSEPFNKITTDGTYTVSTIVPTNSMQYQLIAAEDIYMKLGGTSKYFVEVDICDWVENPTTNMTECVLPDKDENGYYEAEVYIYTDTGKKTPEGFTDYDESIDTLKFKFVESKDVKAKAIAENIISNIENKQFIVSDLSYINYINTIPKGYDETDYIAKALLYSSEFIEKVGNKNIIIHNDPRAGDTMPWDTLAFGFTSLYYNGEIIGVADRSGTNLRNVVYVPDDTADTDEAYIAAAMKRINDYLGKDNGITITKKGTITTALDSDKCNNWPWTHYECITGDIFEANYGGRTNKLDSIYEVTTKSGNKFYIFIEKDSTKISTPVLNIEDSEKDISIASDSGSVPLDTTFVAVYVNDGELFNEAKNKIAGQFVGIDFSLTSEVKGYNVENIAEGLFRVRVPLPKNIDGKNVTVYYITSTGELEEHKATIEDGYAVFETNHFSTYFIAEKIEDVATKNPKTFDNIITYVVMFIISTLGIAKLYLIKKGN